MIENLRRGYRLQNRTPRIPLAVFTEELYIRLSKFKAFCVARFVGDSGVIADSGFLDYDVWIGKYLMAFRGSVLLRHGVLLQELILTHVACVVFWSSAGLISCMLNGQIVW
jgi:hypothetical protein